MGQHLTEKQRKEMQKIMDSMSCKIDFECYKSSFENICKAEYNGQNLVCKISQMLAKSILSYDCDYRLYLGNAYNYYICRCPLRIYIAKKLKR